MKLDRLTRSLRRSAHPHPLWSERLLHDTDADVSGDTAPSRRRLTGATLAVGGLVALLALALLGAALFSDGDGGQAPRTTLETGHGSVSAPPRGASGSTADDEALQRCAAVSSLQRGVLGAARPAMRQWGVHIQAMNRLVAGRITLAQATSFWNRTRVHAAQRIRAFQAADALFTSSSGSLCAEAAAPPADATPALRACLEAVAAGDATVRAARTTLATWQGHVRDMERLRTGMMSPMMAQQMWRQTWKLGDRQLRTYRRDDDRARQLSCAS